VAVSTTHVAEYRVRFDEADAAGRLRPSGFLRFAQDVAWLHSESAGFGRAWYTGRAMHWLVRDVDLQVMAPVDHGDRLTVSTEVVGWRHVWARRHAEVRRGPAGRRRVHDVEPADGRDRAADGELVAIVETDWVLLTDDGRPGRLPPEMAAFLAPGRTFSRRRLDLAATPSSAARTRERIRPADVDPMGHLNNAAYLDIVDEAVAGLPTAPTDDAATRYRIGYLMPALAGTEVEVACWPAGEGSIACRISDATGSELTRILRSPGGP
jgi:acyl-CoA thioesterase FadM